MATSLLPSLPRVWPEPRRAPVTLNRLHSMYYTGLPIDQYYDLTKLKKSNVRSNDELVPRPTQVDMTKLQIDREFPAEHPYSSHMSRFALFPNFANAHGDYEAEGSTQRPLHPQMPANPHPITVVRQSKGGSDRWERQDLPLDTEKKPLKWPGDKFYQQRRTPTSGQQQFYPISPKAVLPNHPSRSLGSALNPRTANALENLERAQWQTTYNKNFTGNGTANSLKLDDFDEKSEKKQSGRIEGNGMRTRSYNTFMPPRPLEGRISRLIGPNQMVRCVVKDGRIQYTPYVPKINFEKEHADMDSETHGSFRTPSGMPGLKSSQTSNNPDTPPRETLSITLSGDTRKKAYDDKISGTSRGAITERYAEDLRELADKSRWMEAELGEHHHDLSLLRRKVDYTSPQMQPPVYYDSLHKIYTTKAPFYYDGVNPYENDFVNPWEYHKTKTVLEDYKRQEEEELLTGKQMTSGKGLSKVPQSGKYQFDGCPGPSPFVSPVGMSGDHQGLRVHSAPPCSPDRIRTIDEPTAMSPSDLSSRPQNTAIDSTRLIQPAKANYNTSSSSPYSTGDMNVPIYDPAYRNPGSNPLVSSRHTNPGGSVSTRVDWSEPEGVMRPQTSLLKMQDSFTKSDARKKFHVTFAEATPDLRDNITTGKKHTFQGENVDLWR